MKFLLPLLLLALCGCRTAAPEAVLPAPAPTMPVRPPPESVPPPRPASVAADTGSRQQTQWIEALLDQNDALTARLAALQSAPVAPPAVAAPNPPAPTPTVGTPLVPAVLDPAIVPNAEGVIDLVTIEHTDNADEPVNPFAVRAVPSEKTREVSLVVGGIIQGAAPCAVINQQLVQAGDSLEGFEVERIEASAVRLRLGARHLRLPVSATPIRVKLPL